MSDETGVTGEVARAVTEFTVTYFGLSDLERDALLDLYADHAYKFAERHGHQTPLIDSHTHPTEEDWGKPDDSETWRHKAIRRNLGMARLERERDEARAEAAMLQERIDAVINLADQWEVAQRENREALERGELAPRKTPDPQDFRYAATGCLEVPAVDPPLCRRGAFERRLGELMGVRRPQDGAQAAQDGAESESEGDRAAGGSWGAPRATGGTVQPGPQVFIDGWTVASTAHRPDGSGNPLRLSGSWEVAP